MRIGIIGAGRLAQSLGGLLCAHGNRVVALASRTMAAAQSAAAFIGDDVRAVPLAEIACYADHLLIAVSDDALEQVAAQLAHAGSLSVVLHTSGSRGLAPLASLAACGSAVGILHPLQTVPTPAQGVKSLPGSFFAVGGDPAAVQWAESFVKTIGGYSFCVGDDAWPLYHAAAVMASNYPCALMDSALELFSVIGMEPDTARSALAPIVRAVINNILEKGPVESLTGPISRGDAGTVEKHLQALAASTPETRQLYRAAGLRTLRIAERRGLPETAVKAIRSALTETKP